MELQWFRVSILAAACLVAASCERGAEEVSATETGEVARGVVMTSFYPLTYFAQRISGGDVEVRSPLPADADPASWRPTGEDVAAMQQAAVVFVNGASFEEWVATAPLARSRVVDTTASLHDALLRYETAVTHSHGLEGTHSHEGIDGHTWLDPVNAMAQAEAVRDGMTNAFPGFEAGFTQRCGALLADLRELDAELRALAPAMEDVAVICSHPAYNYIAQRYGWKIVNVDIPPQEPIADGTIDDLLSRVEEMPSRRIVLWESEPIAANEAVFRERMGAQSVLFSPCEAASEGGDYLERMRENIERLGASVSGGG